MTSILSIAQCKSLDETSSPDEWRAKWAIWGWQRQAGDIELAVKYPGGRKQVASKWVCEVQSSLSNHETDIFVVEEINGNIWIKRKFFIHITVSQQQYL